MVPFITVVVVTMSHHSKEYKLRQVLSRWLESNALPLRIQGTVATSRT